MGALSRNLYHTPGFSQGVHFATGWLYADKLLALDAPKWVTFKPNGENHKGRHVLIEGESGEIIKGMGGKLNGHHVSAISGKEAPDAHIMLRARLKNKDPAFYEKMMSNKNSMFKAENESLKTANSDLQKQIDTLKQQLMKAKHAASKVAQTSQEPAVKGQPPKINLDLPEKIPKDTVLQNRSRANIASVQQMENIARNLDFFRVGVSNDFNSGCPVVSFGQYDNKAFGNKDVLVTPSNKHLEVQYAVVDAKKVNTSHSAHGDVNDKYFSQDPQYTRAIAGNGRMAAIQLAYSSKSDASAKYKQALIDNASRHGCDPKLIASMQNPVLVRVMQPKDVTKDIGDQTNITQGLQLNAVEQSKTDVQRIKNSDLSFETYEDGSPKIDSVKKFIASLPRNEQAGLLTSTGEPSRQAQDRLQNALMMAGYGSDYLVKLRGQAIDPDGKNILTALSNASNSFAKLEGAGDYDVRKVLNAVVEGFSQYSNMGKGTDFKWQADLMESNDFNQKAKEIAELVNANKRSSAKLSIVFKTLADHMVAAYEEKNHLSSGGSLFGLEDFDISKAYKSADAAFKEALESAKFEISRREAAKLSRSNPGSLGLGLP